MPRRRGGGPPQTATTRARAQAKAKRARYERTTMANMPSLNRAARNWAAKARYQVALKSLSIPWDNMASAGQRAYSATRRYQNQRRVNSQQARLQLNHMFPLDRRGESFPIATFRARDRLRLAGAPQH